MTAYRGQRSTERKVAGAGWGVGDLRRRPAPASGGASFSLAPPKYMWAGPELYDRTSAWNNTGEDGDGTQLTFDAAAPFGAYVETTNQDEWIMFGMPLCPRGSVWGVEFWYYQQPGGGKIQIEWMTTSIDELTPEGNGTAFSIDHPYYYYANPSTPPFYTPSSPHFRDTYVPGGSEAWVNTGPMAGMVIDGTDGQMLSANGGSTVSMPGFFLSCSRMRGGGDPSVYWWLRLRAYDKNGSASGYKMRLAMVKVFRRSGDLLLIG